MKLLVAALALVLSSCISINVGKPVPQAAPALRAAQSVVKLNITATDGEGSCSGWIYMETKVITAGHCAESTLLAVTACLYPDTECDNPIPLTLVGADHVHDVAVFAFPKGFSAPGVTLNTRPLEIGDGVMAVGFPQGDFAVTIGVFSMRHAAEDLWDSVHVEWIQHSADTAPGSSGGALFDTEGRLVGMTVGMVTYGRTGFGLGIAIPMDIILASVNAILE